MWRFVLRESEEVICPTPFFSNISQHPKVSEHLQTGPEGGYDLKNKQGFSLSLSLKSYAVSEVAQGFACVSSQLSSSYPTRPYPLYLTTPCSKQVIHPNNKHFAPCTPSHPLFLSLSISLF